MFTSYFFGTVSLLLQLFIPYTRYVKYLKWLTLSLFAYVAASFFAHAPWRQVFWLTFRPQVTFTRQYLTALVAVLGTTISPYLFFWQASQEVEEVKNNRGEKPLSGTPSRPLINLVESRLTHTSAWRSRIWSLSLSC